MAGTMSETNRIGRKRNVVILDGSADANKLADC
jgi:hypothetical protein